MATRRPKRQPKRKAEDQPAAESELNMQINGRLLSGKTNGRAEHMTATVTTTDPPEVAAFWAAIGARPDDQLRRLVFADWLEERAGTVRCRECEGDGDVWDDGGYKYAPRKAVTCHTCSGTGYVSNGYADLAAALRATACKVPFTSVPESGRRAGVRYWSWICELTDDRPDTVTPSVFDSLTGEIVDGYTNWRDYPTAEGAIRDLCAAWCKVNGKGVSA